MFGLLVFSRFCWNCNHVCWSLSGNFAWPLTWYCAWIKACKLHACKKLKRYRYCKRTKSPNSFKFCQHALPYHLVLRCCRRGGRRPSHEHWNTYFVTFKRQLSQAILYRQATRLRYQVLCNLYVDKVYEKSKVAHKPNMLDSNNLGGVHADIYSPFLNLHNPLAVHQPTASENILPASINYTGASYF